MRLRLIISISALISLFFAVQAFAQGPEKKSKLGNPIPKITVTTYHYDTFRTGWNSHEVLLNPSLRPPGPPTTLDHFGLVRRVALDDVVYAQPLIVPDVIIGKGSASEKHDVVYVVTENNSVYAIDANTGAILLIRNLGLAVVAAPHNCANNGPRLGIESTPVIDLAHHAIYLISYSDIRGQPTFRLHAIDLSTLGDQAPPVVVSASHKLVDGSTFPFNAADHRQRAALLFADGNIYAGFASWCDTTPARGWLLGWRAFDLRPLAANTLTDRQAASSRLSSIWMAGYGVAAVAGHLYFATGNTPHSPGYDSSSNLSESVVKVSSDLTRVLDFFTPSNVGQLDMQDVDLGSGGVLLLPDQPGPIQHMAAAAGKDGRMFLINREQMGGFSPTADNVLDIKAIGHCWCGQSYYLNNIVSSGGTRIGVWQVNTSPTPSVTQIHSSIDIGGSGDGGFFTSISSNGNADVIIWAVSRQNSSAAGPPPRLLAFQPIPGTSDLKLLFPSPPGNPPGFPAGNWDLPPLRNGTLSDADSNIVPVVANGHVYVASNRELDIFGFVPPVIEPAPSPSGVITMMNGSHFTLKTETGAEVQVEAEPAIKNGLSPELAIGQAVSVYGSKDAQDLLHADVIRRAHIAIKP
jgi:hypothetical protein